jgi:hypothetical protein
LCFEKLISLSFMITPKRGLSNSRELSLTPLEFIGLSEAALERPGQLRQKAQKVDVTSGEVKRMAVMMVGGEKFERSKVGQRAEPILA